MYAIKQEQQLHIPTVQEAFEAYCEIRRIKPKSEKNYKQRLNSCIPDWMNLSIADITGEMVVTRHREVSRRTPTQANACMQTLGMIFSWACQYWTQPDGQPLPLYNPVNRLSVIRAWNKQQSRKDRYIRDEHLKEWWDEVHKLQNVHVRDLLVFLLLSGVRVGEALNLTWEHLDFDNRTFHIPNNKSNRPVTLPMSDYVWELLATRKKMFPVTVYVFMGRRTDLPISSPYYITTVMNKENPNIKFRPHDLRRSYSNISTHPDVGANELAIKAMLNHAPKSVTDKHYLTPHIELLRPIVQGVTDYVLHKVEN